MRYVALIFLLPISHAVNAQQASPSRHHEIVFTSARDLLSWRESEARAHFAAAGRATYQWAGRHHMRGDTLHAEGQLRVDDQDISVRCRAAKGTRERHAVMEFEEAE
ncbi:MAG: hypothetical protein LBU11_12060 [Zoogloeaceae bacterium]|jgi:hypothetical protein|nr:hypothetical protein [Zoogloeaceae bacterium]